MKGARFGRLVVTGDTPTRSHNKRRILWQCLCDCGATVLVDQYYLRTAHTKSCGCYRSDKARKCSTTHGLSGTRTYNAWVGMRARCNDPKSKRFHRYGGRGIAVCERWSSFENFVADMGIAPENTDIDRVNNNGNYEPGNCRWATRTQNSRNRHNSIFLTYKGKTKHIYEWAECIGICPSTLYARKRKGWSDEKTVTTPPRLQKNSANVAWIEGEAQGTGY